MKVPVTLCLIGGLLLAACKKKVMEPTECPTADNTNNATILQFPDMDYSYPRFNPSNMYEIVFVEFDNKNNKMSIVKYNLVTKVKSTLVERVYQRPDWSKRGWIVFNHGDNQVWKIKEN